MEELRRAIHRHFAPHRHSALLIAIIAAFAVRPLIGDTGASTALFGVALVLLLLVALYNINVDELVGERDRLLVQGRRRRIIGWVLASAGRSGTTSDDLCAQPNAGPGGFDLFGCYSSCLSL